MRSELIRVRAGIGPLPDPIERTRKQTESVPNLLPVVKRKRRYAVSSLEEPSFDDFALNVLARRSKSCA